MYVPVTPGRDGLYSCTSLKLKLGLRDGWLRWFLPDGELLLTGAERAELERSRADQAEAELARLRAEIERLRGA